MTSSPAPEPRAAEHARSVPPAGRDCPGMATYGKVWQGLGLFFVVFCCFLLFSVATPTGIMRDLGASVSWCGKDPEPDAGGANITKKWTHHLT